MTDGGLTDKRLENKRFRKTEEAIFVTFFEGTESFASMRQVAVRAGVSKSALYRHHRSLTAIVHDYEEYLLGKYITMMSEILAKSDVSTKIMVTQMVLFILRYKRVFVALFRNGKKGPVVRKMVKQWEARIKKDLRAKAEYRKLLNVYAGEVLGVIDSWGEEGFEEDDAKRVVNDIVYLTDTIEKRLGVLK